MLPEGRRLRKRREFDAIFREGRICDKPQLRIVWTPGSGRAAVVAAKSIGSPARRNTVRRRWREAMRDAIRLIPNDLGLVIVVKPEGAKERGESLRTALESALGELAK